MVTSLELPGSIHVEVGQLVEPHGPDEAAIRAGSELLTPAQARQLAAELVRAAALADAPTVSAPGCPDWCTQDHSRYDCLHQATPAEHTGIEPTFITDPGTEGMIGWTASPEQAEAPAVDLLTAAGTVRATEDGTK